MRKTFLSHRGLLWALAAALAVAAPGAPRLHAAPKLTDSALLASELPSGETLSSAPMKDLAAAVRAAVSQRPAAASEIVRIAIMAKYPKLANPSCPMVRNLVAAAVAAAPQQARRIMETAEAIVPDCAEAIASITNTGAVPSGITTGAVVPGSTTGETGGDAATGSTGGDFGQGFGTGFPGSPGFSGSAPSGGFALPTPAPSPVTSTAPS